MKETASLELRVVESFPEPEFTALRTLAFADFGEPSTLLADALAEERAKRSWASGPNEGAARLRLGAFMEDKLVGWSYSEAEGSRLHMVNSGVLPDFRRMGIYSRLVEVAIAHAEAHGFANIFSRHAPSNNAVIIPKLRLGFMVSGFEYSEAYGPLVQLTYLTVSKRRELYRVRSRPVVPGEPSKSA